ncbi:SMR family transporter [Aureispira sp. CCB-E]|uniref:DMT family transporter n=1 Tax=Aureispira sp. CCB-E TaxID=3051121 RepID=UPI0028689F50|nr:SMR family transporter [Aureispira sp. CCB-E]WMX13543.1 SMR family transporter [Aureispira sp. CCB-E]
MTYVYLALAILCEVVGTSCLKASNEFKEWLPTLGVILGYIGSMYFMTLSLRKLTLGTVYATWSGLGIVLVALFGFIFYKEKLDTAAIIGMSLIIAGVLIMNLVSKTNVH